MDRATARFATAEQSLAEAYRGLRAAGVDRDTVDTAFAVLRDCIAEVKACSEQARRELALAHYEWDQVNRRHLNQAQYSETAASSPMPDMPGFNLCPDPVAVRSPAEFMDCLRRYRIWSGKPSYRAMERQCGRRYAASTIYTALKGSELPSLPMVQAIIAACRGPEEHQVAFGSAWRRLQMQEDVDQPAKQSQRTRALHAVSGTA